MSTFDTKELYPSVAGVNVVVISNSTRHAHGTSKVFLQLVNYKIRKQVIGRLEDNAF